MYFTVRERFRKQSTKKFSYNELDEIDFKGVPILNEKIVVKNKSYKIVNIIIADGMIDKKNPEITHDENFLDVEEVSKNYEFEKQEDIRRDRFGHQVIIDSDTCQRTVDEKGKTIRKWEYKQVEGKNYKDWILVSGEPYPENKNKESV